jgi:hypothetical protein
MLTSGPYTLQLARWPNRGFAHLDEVVDMGPTLRWLTNGQRPRSYSYDKPVGGRFTLREPINLEAWQRELARTNDIRQRGYLSNDWTEDKNQVARITDDGVLQLLDSTRYGIGGIRYRGGKEDAIYNVEQVVGKQGWNKAPWRDAFPNFPKYMNGNPFAQSYGSMLNNYHNFVDPEDPFDVIHIHKHWALPTENRDDRETSMADMPETFTYNAPMPIEIDKTFVDPSKLDFRLKPGVQFKDGFKPCDLDKVGLFKSEYRTDAPYQAAYRSAIYERYRGTKSWGGRYNPDTAYLRYPLQPWME